MKHAFVLTLGLFAAGALTLPACSSRNAGTAPAASPMTVQVAHAEERDIAPPFEVGGVVRAREIASIVSRIMAEVTAIPVRPGDRVRAGQIVAQLDARELSANRARAEAGRAAAEQATALAEADRQAADAALVLARATHQRMADLRSKNSATQHELDEAVANLRAAEARLKVAEARVLEARAAIEGAAAAATAARVSSSYATLTAPFDGLVTEKLIDVGNMAAPGVPLLTIEDTRAFRLELRLDESRAALVHPGDRVEVRIERTAVPGSPAPDARQTAVGTVQEIARMLEPGSHDFRVKVDLPALPDLRSGMFGRAIFRGAPHRAVTVPETAVATRGQLAFVFVVDGDNVARLRLVNTSPPVDGLVEVRAGLVAGERVVVAPPPLLVDGTPVTASASAVREAR